MDGTMYKPWTSICVNYKNVDGWHVFMSDDMPGLYVAHQDAKTAYDDLCPAIQTLLELDEGVTCRVQPELSFKEFVEQAKAGDAERVETQRPMLQLSDKRFAVFANAA